MKNLSLRAGLYILRPSSNPSCSTSINTPIFLRPIKVVVLSCGTKLKHRPLSKFAVTLREQTPPPPPVTLKHTTVDIENSPSCQSQRPLLKLLIPVPENGHSRIVIMGAASVGILVLLSGLLDDQKAWALGPEGPLVEEFWDNVRRYALYALTVSTGAIYTIVQPIFELLKNPISAILVIAIFGGSIYIVSQVLSAMVGVSDFTYDYAY